MSRHYSVSLYVSLGVKRVAFYLKDDQNFYSVPLDERVNCAYMNTSKLTEIN